MKNANIDFGKATKSICPHCKGELFRPTKMKGFIQCVGCLKVWYYMALEKKPFN